MRSQPRAFPYLDQDDVIRAGALDMARAIDPRGAGLVTPRERRLCRSPEIGSSLERGPRHESIRGRINFLSAYLGGPIDSVGMKSIEQLPI